MTFDRRWGVRSIARRIARLIARLCDCVRLCAPLRVGLRIYGGLSGVPIPWTQAYRGKIVCPNKQTTPGEKYYNNKLIESETYIGAPLSPLAPAPAAEIAAWPLRRPTTLRRP